MQKSKFPFLFFFCVFFWLCLCLCFCFYADSEIVQSTVNITIAGKVKYSGSDLTVTAPIPVEDDKQKILRINSTYQYEISGGKIIFHPEGDYVIDITVSRNFSGIKNISRIPQISRISTPSENNLSEFLKNEGLTAWNEEIRKKAEEISAGENDLIKIAKIAKYVHDAIKYDTSVDLMPSVWVFENKRGKCSEFADLFISMCRSVGISARAVNGFACSGLCERHAWAEVLIGGAWVEADPTFMQVPADASHIVFLRSFECRKMITGVTWSGAGVEHENEIYAKMVSNNSEDFFDFEVVHEKITGQESVLPVSISMKNKKDFFVVGFCRILVKDLKDEEKIFYLMPDSSGKINFDITIPRMNENYTYKYSLMVRCSSISKTSEFNVYGNEYGSISVGVEISDFDLSKKTFFLENTDSDDLNVTLEVCAITGIERKCETSEINLKAEETYAYDYGIIFPEGNFTLQVTAHYKDSDYRKEIFVPKSENPFENLNYLLIAVIFLLASIALFKLIKKNK